MNPLQAFAKMIVSEMKEIIMAANLDPAEEARKKGLEIKKEIDRKNGIYSRALSKLELGYSEAALREAAELFAQIPDWKDSAAKREEALKKADEVYNETVYKKALKLAQRGDAASLADAVETMKKVSAWRDAVNKAEEFELAFTEIKKKEKKKREEKERTKRNRELYEEKYRALLDSEDKVGAKLIETVEKLKVYEQGSSSGLYMLLNFIAVVISIISYILYKDGNQSPFIIAGIFFAPLTIVLSIAAGIAGIVKRNRMERQRDELTRKMRVIRSIPDFEEYNRVDHSPEQPEPADETPDKKTDAETPKTP